MKDENKELIREHLNNSRTASNVNDAYLLCWKAFNIMYEVELSNRNITRTPSEVESAKFCANYIDTDLLQALFESKEITELMKISPIKNIRDLYRKNIENTHKFDVLKSEVDDVTNFDYPKKLDSLIELLYLVRCNLDHGFKSRERQRDQEVLTKTKPLLEFVVNQLTTHYSI